MKQAICIAALLAFPLTSALAADTYTLDPRHTYPRWAASHLGFSTHQGQFNKTTGKLVLDAKGGTGSVEVTVDAASVSTGDPKFDAHLKSADFFEAAKHPTITFKSTSMNSRVVNRYPSAATSPCSA